MKRLICHSLVFLLTMSGVAQACSSMATDQTQPNLFDARYNLIDHRGAKATPERFKGTYQLVFFGFTNCPDVCPIGLDVIYRALDLLPEETRTKAQPILITVDPARDTSEVLANYVQAFDAGLIGLTGSKEAIDDATRAFGVLAVKDHTSHEGHYNMNHTSSIYVVGPDGQACGTAASDVSAADLRDRFAVLLN